jgi:hypothetical protein
VDYFYFNGKQEGGMPGWLHPIAMSKIQRAFAKRADTVSLDGKEFTITYDKVIHMRTSESIKCIWIAPVQDFIPCGYIPYKAIEEFEFEG